MLPLNALRSFHHESRKASLSNKVYRFDSFWEKTSSGLIYNVKANRFLQHMVRFLVGTMIEVGRGRMSFDDFKLFMDGGHSELCVVRAPAHGLYLAEVSYA